MPTDDAATRIHAAGKLLGFGAFAIISLALLATVLSLAAEILMILFLGGLFGVFLVGGSRLIAKHFHLSYPWALAASVTGLIALGLALLLLFGVQISNQVERAKQYADQALEHVREYARESPMARTALEATPLASDLLSLRSGRRKSNRVEESQRSERNDAREDRRSRASDEPASSSSTRSDSESLRGAVKQGAGAVAQVFRTTFGFLVNGVLIFFIGLFLATSPEEYRDGFARLFPPNRRRRTRDVLAQVGETLWNWLMGRFATMAITGVGAAALLLILGVPMAITLGVLTALLCFVPNIGSVVALGLAVLFALPEGGTTVMLVVAGYIALQLAESYVITPMIQREQASLPPALLLAFQAVMGVLFGVLGAAIASPLLAATKVIVEQVYIQDVLENGTN